MKANILKWCPVLSESCLSSTFQGALHVTKTPMILETKGVSFFACPLLKQGGLMKWSPHRTRPPMGSRAFGTWVDDVAVGLPTMPEVPAFCNTAAPFQAPSSHSPQLHGYHVPTVQPVVPTPAYKEWEMAKSKWPIQSFSVSGKTKVHKVLYTEIKGKTFFIHHSWNFLDIKFWLTLKSSGHSQTIVTMRSPVTLCTHTNILVVSILKTPG